MPLELSVTPAAGEKINRIRTQGGRADACLRLEITGRRGGRFVYSLGLVEPAARVADDVVVETPGLQILVDPESARHLQGAVIDLDPSAIGGALTIENPNEGWQDPLAARVQEVLDRQINPGVAAHGGFVDLLDVRDGAAYVELGGGCQGCAQVDVTLRQGIEVAIKQAVPEITRVIDRTDHASGRNPYFQAAKKAS